MGEKRKDALRVDFDRRIKLNFHGSKVSSDTGLFPFRELDEACGLTESSATELFDFRSGRNRPARAHCHASVAIVRGNCERYSIWNIGGKSLHCGSETA